MKLKTIVMLALALFAGAGAASAAFMKFTESYVETLKIISDGMGGRYADPVSTYNGSVTVSVPLSEVNIASFDGATAFEMFLGGASCSHLLGDDPAYTPGKRTATFRELTENEAGQTIEIQRWVLTWSPTNLTVTLTSKDAVIAVVDLFGKQGEAGPFDGTTDASITLDSFQVSRTVFYRGKNTVTQQRFVDGEWEEFFDLNNIQASGEADFVPPVLNFQTPVANARLVNELLTIKGTASDSNGIAMVSSKIENHPDYTDYVDIDAVTNWQADVLLQPGTNVIAVKAVDSSGNETVAKRSVFYVVTSPLTIALEGQGTVAPLKNGTNLVVGQRYTLTAAPAPGNGFVAWGGDVTGTNPVLNFIMRSNLVVRARFQDNQRPVITLTSPKTDLSTGNPVVTVTGNARDNIGIAQVAYQVNGGAPQSAARPDATNWFINLPLMPGTNRLAVKATDAAGNWSLPAPRLIYYLVTNVLTVRTNGKGSVLPVLNNQKLLVGRGYTLTAAPGANQMFAQWTGSLTSTAPVLNFVMQSNMVLVANFVPNPYLTRKGNYNGLFSVSSEVRHDSSGFCGFALTDKGAFTGRLVQGGVSYPLAGVFTAMGQASVQVSRMGKPSLLVALALDVSSQTDVVEGTVTDGFWTADLYGDRQVYHALTNKAPQAGKYTLSLGATDTPATSPAGYSYGTVTVDAGGNLLFNGTLGDGTPVSQASAVSKDGYWPFYVPLYNGKGSILCWIGVTPQTPPSLWGYSQAFWFKPGGVPGKYYPKGFTNETQVAGSKYVTPANSRTPVLAFTNGFAQWFGGNLTNALNTTALLTNNLLTLAGTNQAKVTLNLQNGTFAGSFRHPVRKQVVPMNGVLLPEQKTAAGTFLGTNQTGRILIQP